MIIECTRCRTRAKLPDSKEGAKVRCPECGHVYVANPGGSRAASARRKEDPTKYVIIGGAVVVFAVIMIIASKDGNKTTDAAPPDEEVADTGPVIPTTGFDSPLVKEAREMHDLAAASNRAALLLQIDFPEVHAWEMERAEETEDTTPYPALDIGEQQVYRNDVLTGLSTGRWRELVADWVPYDGEVVEETPQTAVVRVRCHHRDPQVDLADRWVEWHFEKDVAKDRWLATSWERWISPEEKQAERQKRARTTTKTTLSDGSEVIEGEVREDLIEWHPETPEPLREEIVALIDQMLDMEAPPKQVTRAREALEEIGKHAVPGLLMRIARISPDMGPAGSEIDEDFQLTYDQAVQIQLCHMTLTVITDWNTSYDVHAAMGTTQERQGSGIRQWFGWYGRKFRLFWRDADEVEEDPLWDDPDFRPRNEKERREFEKHRREAQEKDGG